jgi:hypothetical protein
MSMMMMMLGYYIRSICFCNASDGVVTMIATGGGQVVDVTDEACDRVRFWYVVAVMNIRLQKFILKIR